MKWHEYKITEQIWVYGGKVGRHVKVTRQSYLKASITETGKYRKMHALSQVKIWNPIFLHHFSDLYRKWGKQGIDEENKGTRDKWGKQGRYSNCLGK